MNQSTLPETVTLQLVGVTSYFNSKLIYIPAARSKEAILHACPTHQVDIGGKTYCMVSYIPNPDVITPPGELIYKCIGLEVDSA